MDNNKENAERYLNLIELDQENIGVKTKKVEDTKVYWDDTLEKTFILLMEEEVRQENCFSSTFDSIGWRHLVDGMIEKTEKIFTKEQLRNKFNDMRGATMTASMAENANMEAERNEIVIATTIVASSSTNLASRRLEEQEVVSLSKDEMVQKKCNLCIRALNALERVDDIHYCKALQLLHDDELWRDLFLQIPDERKVGWVMNL